jgi:hypothetical protein
MSCAPPSVTCDDRRREERSPQLLGKPPDLGAFKNLAGTNPESADALVCTDTSICAADAHRPGAR